MPEKFFANKQIKKSKCKGKFLYRSEGQLARCDYVS